MRSYRKRQVVKVYKMPLFAYKLVLDGDVLTFEKSKGFEVRNRAFCSIMDHCTKPDDVGKLDVEEKAYKRGYEKGYKEAMAKTKYEEGK